MQEAFWNQHGLQCGFCTPGMIMASRQLLERNPHPTEEEIRHGLEGNLCRCTGYQHIVNAVKAAAAKGGSVTGRTWRPPSPKLRTLVGKRIRRKEDPRLITGTATYVDDIKMPGMHHACILRSPHAAARIRSINMKPALDLPGVVAVFTGEDIDGVGPVPCGASLPGLRVPPHSILAKDRVYFVGHPVAVVVATDRYIAADALDLIEVEYEPLPAVADPEKALAPGAPAVHPEWPDNTAFTLSPGGRRPRESVRRS